MWKVGDRLTHRHNPELGLGQVIAVDARTADGRVRARRGSACASRPPRSPCSPSSCGPGGACGSSRRARRRASRRTCPTAASAWRTARWRTRRTSGRSSSRAPSGERLAAGDVDPHRGLRDAPGRAAPRGARARRRAWARSWAGASASSRTSSTWPSGRRASRPRALAAGRRGGPGQDGRGLPDPEPPRAHAAAPSACLIVAPGHAHRAVAGRAVAQVPPGVRAARRGPRLADVARDFGADFNPFDAHRRVGGRARDAGGASAPHASRRSRPASTCWWSTRRTTCAARRGHAGRTRPSARWRRSRALGRHVLLLTATPLEDDAHGFFRLLQLLRPDEFPEDDDFDGAARPRGEPLPPCTSSTRRGDIGGLPPRVARAGRAAAADAGRRSAALEDAVRARARPPNALARKRKAERRAARAGARARRWPPCSSRRRAELQRAGRGGGRDATRASPGWPRGAGPGRQRGEKTLVFVRAPRDARDAAHGAQPARAARDRRVPRASSRPPRRDIEVAQFRLPEGAEPARLHRVRRRGPQLRVLPPAGALRPALEPGRGRAAHRPARPHRPRALPVEIVYFRAAGRHRGGGGRALFEALGPLPRAAGRAWSRSWRAVEAALEAAAARPDGAARARTRSTRSSASARQARDAHPRGRVPASCTATRTGPRSADGILARVPADLDALNEDGGGRPPASGSASGSSRSAAGARFSIEFGNEALVDSLPGVPGGSSFLGTFDREEAVADETLDFFAAGHPLVEGVLAHLEEAPRGRVAVAPARGSGPSAASACSPSTRMGRRSR